jgi:hypothetical protein
LYTCDFVSAIFEGFYLLSLPVYATAKNADGK